MPRDALEEDGAAPGETVATWQQEQTKKLAPPEPPEPERVRLRLDVPQWLRDAAIASAEAEDTSISQLAAFLLAYGLALYQDGDPDLAELLQASKTLSRNIRWGHGIDLAALADRLSGR